MRSYAKKRNKQSKSMKNVWKKKRAIDDNADCCSTESSSYAPEHCDTNVEIEESNEIVGNWQCASTASASDVEHYDMPFDNTTQTEPRLMVGNDEQDESEWIDITDIPDDDLPPLIIESSPAVEASKSAKSAGNRIVNLEYFVKQIELKEMHKTKCTYGKFEYVREVRTGMVSTLVYKCVQCDDEFRVKTQAPDDVESFNDAAVWGTLSTGNGRQQFEELMAVMDTPVMSPGKFRRHEFRVENQWMSHLSNKMREAGEEEKREAIRKGHFMNGKPYITVIVDGGWSKRSYRHSYTAPSGVVVIIGAHTNKILYLGVKNKYCLACDKAKRAGVAASKHKCYLNFRGSSSSMEQIGIVEGFNSSIEQHGLIYRFVVGDGDSSVISRIKTNVKGYGRYVEKHECANHVVRCYKQNLYKILSTTKLYELEARHILKPVVERLGDGARAAIRYCEGNVSQLKADFKNGPYHVMGDHSNCSNRFCTRKDKGETNHVLTIQNTKVWKEMTRLADGLVSKAHSLKDNYTTNQAERLMGLVSKFNGGKRVNNATGGGYERRCVGAGLAHTSGPSWHLSPFRAMVGKSPGTVMKSVMEKRENRAASKRRLFEEVGPPPKRKRSNIDIGGRDYGPGAYPDDLAQDELEDRMAQHLEHLRKIATPEDSKRLERATVGQRENDLWKIYRKDILTASHFASICKRRPYTSCHNKVSDILAFTKNLETAAIQYGIRNERIAIECYSRAMNVEVEECGLFVNPEWPYVGASPDGLVGNDVIVEVKCLPSIGSMHPVEAAANPKNKTCAEIIDGKLRLKPLHDYMYQIQGQLNISDRQFCDLILYSDGGFEITRIERDREFWVDKMLPKLRQYFHECLLPEIADSRVNREMRVRDPPFIQIAIDEWAAKKEAAKNKKLQKEVRKKKTKMSKSKKKTL